MQHFGDIWSHLTSVVLNRKPNSYFIHFLLIKCIFLLHSFILIGKTDLSTIDPVVVGRGAFATTNDLTNGVLSYIEDMLCAMVDPILDAGKGIYWIPS